MILPEVAHVSLVNQRYSYFVILSDFSFFVFAPFSNKIWGNNFKKLCSAYGWGYAVCYEALHIGGWGWRNKIFSVT